MKKLFINKEHGEMTDTTETMTITEEIDMAAMAVIITTDTPLVLVHINLLQLRGNIQ